MCCSLPATVKQMPPHLLWAVLYVYVDKFLVSMLQLLICNYFEKNLQLSTVIVFSCQAGPKSQKQLTIGKHGGGIAKCETETTVADKLACICR